MLLSPSSLSIKKTHTHTQVGKLTTARAHFAAEYLQQGKKLHHFQALNLKFNGAGCSTENLLLAVKIETYREYKH